MPNAQLFVLEGDPDYLCQVFLISENKMRLLGRSSVCHFQINDLKISSMHCYFIFENNHFAVYDLLSMNGVFVNQNLIDHASLKEGDIIRIGKTVLEFSIYKGDEEGKKYITGDNPNIVKVVEDADAKNEEASKVTLGRMIKNPKDLVICRLAVKNQMLMHETIKDLIRFQEERDADTIEELLVQQGILTAENITNLLKEHTYFKARSKDLEFGNVAIASGLVPEEQVQEFLKEQEDHFTNTKETVRLGAMLVEKEVLTKHQNNLIIKHLQSQKTDQKK
ncbi:MAG: FHA domain-containing protein [Planctomycetes bacterium]|jgi:pSer/pThr/pTyr-binding forkhead associated (FHA) protein|nr:FHA domain-containing protein [Planctomycetota bacterium]HPY75553.1 FHA domain-containing protein [Planctomycetota bacterium]HQB01458.1 FHA domain-containing protein [Planctomycetota bacterium]HRU52809.1 FHA domain-containing protein [Planctomycetota bacterium]